MDRFANRQFNILYISYFANILYCFPLVSHHRSAKTQFARLKKNINVIDLFIENTLLIYSTITATHYRCIHIMQR